MLLEENKPGFRPPPGTQTIGMWLFLASLFMLFAASMMAYIFIRINGPKALPAHSVHPPQLLWASTALIFGVSICLHAAIKCVRRERQAMLRRWLLLTLLCAAGFIAIQTPALVELLADRYGSQTQGLILLYGLMFVLILLHALHVVGGMIGLAIVVRQGFKGVYDHEHYYGLTTAAMYWHFLDAVWLVMFSMFWLLG